MCFSFIISCLVVVCPLEQRAPFINILRGGGSSLVGVEMAVESDLRMKGSAAVGAEDVSGVFGLQRPVFPVRPSVFCSSGYF